MKKVFHPFLFAIYPTLFLFSESIETTPFRVAIWPMLLSLIFVTICFFGLNTILRNPEKTGLMITLGLFLFFSYGHMHSFIHGRVVDHDLVQQIFKIKAELITKEVVHLVLLGLWGTLFVLGLGVIHILKQDHRLKLTGFGNVTGLILIALPLLTLVITGLRGRTDAAESVQVKKIFGTREAVSDLGYNPDIYYIILDGYGRQDVLSKYFNFDNKDFLGFLRQQDFFVATQSRSNYFWTFLSLASSLNMKHIDYLQSTVGWNNKSRDVLYEMVDNNEVANFLRERGYKIVHLNSTVGGTMDNPHADYSIACSDRLFHIDFYRVLMESSLFKLWESPVITDLAACHLANFKALETIGFMKGPKFVFAHFILPHHPYLFDREGNILKHATVSNQFEYQKKLWSKRDKYIDQLIFLNKRIKKVVSEILEKSEKPPIIIIQSDHGPTLLTKHKQLHPNNMSARFPILLAVYLPKSRNILSDNETSVNLFRKIFNGYFQTDLEIHEEKFFYSQFSRPYKFQRVYFNTQGQAGFNDPEGISTG